MYGRTINVTVNGRTFRIMSTGDGFLWRETGTFGPPAYSPTMADICALIGTN